MKLYEIDQVIETLLNNGLVYDEATGEVLFTSVDIEKLQMEKEKKVENIALYIKDLQAEAVALKTEEHALYERRKTTEKKIERLSDFIKFILKGERFQTSRVEIKYTKSQSVNVLDEKSIPDEFKTIITEKKPNKKAIKEALKNGMTVNGATLEEHNNIQIK